MEIINFERNRSIEELDFGTLGVGDVITVKTQSGTDYRFSVKGHGEKVVVGIEQRNRNLGVYNDHPVEWEGVDLDGHYVLKGSCADRRIIEDGPPVQTTPGQFVTGERAWLATESNHREVHLVTPTVNSIAVEKVEASD